jgi:hypothetical protein
VICAVTTKPYLRQHRGLSERTIGHCWRFAAGIATEAMRDPAVKQKLSSQGAELIGDIAAYFRPGRNACSLRESSAFVIAERCFRKLQIVQGASAGLCVRHV